MPSDGYIIVDDVREAEDAARHAALVSIREEAGKMVLRFNNRTQLTIRAEGVQVIETGRWEP